MGEDRPLSGQVAQTAWAVVIEPGGACNRYRWDAARGALVMEYVERPDANGARRGADLARLPLLSSASTTSATSTPPDDAALAASGPGLLALALASPANPAGVWLELRILGAFRLVMTRVGQSAASAGLLTDYIALAVPTADPMLASITSIETLTPALRERLQRALLVIAPDAAARIYQGLYEPEALRSERNGMAGAGWLEAAAIMDRYRAERVEASRQAAERRREEEAAHAERLTTSAEAAGEALLRRLGREAPLRPAHPETQQSDAPDIQDVVGGWRGLAGISPSELRARGAAVYGEPEDLLRWLPARFARYLGELLFADERALFFAAASAISLPGWDGRAPLWAPEVKHAGPARQTARGWLPGRLFGAGRTRRLHDGLLLISDRQALLLRDYAPADSGGTHLGFLARSWPLGRLVAAGAAPVGVSLAEALRAWPERVRARLCAPLPFDEAAAPLEQTARLLLALEGRDGIQVTGMAFPPEAAESARRAAALLRGFIPLLGDAGHGDWRLRCVPVVTAWRPNAREERELESLGGMVAPAVASALLEATQRGLAPDETILAQGRTPQSSLAEGPDVPALLTLTPQRLLLATLPQRADVHSTQLAHVEATPLGALTSLTQIGRAHV